MDSLIILFLWLPPWPCDRLCNRNHESQTAGQLKGFMNCKQTCMHYEWWNKSKSAWQGRRYPNLKNSSLNISTLLFKCHVLPLLQWRGCVSVIQTLCWRIQIGPNSFVKWSLTSIMGHVVLYRFWVVFSQRSCFLMSTFSQLFSIKCSITGYTSFKGFPDSTGTCSLCVFVLWRAHCTLCKKTSCYVNIS